MKIVKKIRKVSYYVELGDGLYLNVDLNAGPQRCHQLFVVDGFTAGCMQRYFLRRFPSGYWVVDNGPQLGQTVAGPFPCRMAALVARRFLFT